MDGSRVLPTSFMQHEWGYATSDVDALLDAVACDLAAGRSAGPRIRAARFERKSGYDVCAVDLFLAERLCEARLQPAGDAWQEMTVGHQKRLDPASEVPFDELPGKRLYLKRDFLDWRSRLITDGGDVVTSAWGNRSISVGAARYKLRRISRPDKGDDSVMRSIASRSLRDALGHYAAGYTDADLSGRLPAVDPLCGEDGTTIFSISGSNFDHRATASISFSEDDFLRFAVGGTSIGGGTMTAVDGRGIRVACYRLGRSWSQYKIAINPAWELTPLRLTAIAMAGPLFLEYFSKESP